VLLYGPPGLGKTTLANIIAAEMQTPIKTVSGPALEKSADLAAILTNLSEAEVLFIDEIHRPSPAIEEMLYSAMEDYKLGLIIGQGPSRAHNQIRPATVYAGGRDDEGRSNHRASSQPVRDNPSPGFLLAARDGDHHRPLCRAAGGRHR